MAHLIWYCDWLAKIVSFLMSCSAKECKCMRQMDEKFFSCYISCTNNYFNEWIQHSLKHLLNTDLWTLNTDLLTLSLTIQKSYFDVSAYSLVGHQTLHNVSPYKKRKEKKNYKNLTNQLVVIFFEVIRDNM